MEAKAAGATEELKARDQLAWVGLMNNCKARVEEIIRADLIYAFTALYFNLGLFPRCQIPFAVGQLFFQIFGVFTEKRVQENFRGGADE